MPILGVNFDTVPDKILPIGSGTYTMEVLSSQIEPNKAKKDGGESAKGAGDNLVTELKVISEGEYLDRRITSYSSTKMHTNIKRLALSCQVDLSKGLNTDDLIGKNCRVVIEQGTYTPPGGTPRPNSQIKDFLIPGDDGYAV